MMEVVEAGLSFSQQLKVIISHMGTMEQVPLPLKHYFAPGVYIREIFMPAGTIVIGKIHKTEHFNILLQGRCSIVSENDTHELKAPLTFVSKAGVQKALYIHEDMIWQTVHLTDERDLDKLEAQLIEPDGYPVFDRSEERAAIKAAASQERLMITQETSQ